MRRRFYCEMNLFRRKEMYRRLSELSFVFRWMGFRRELKYSQHRLVNGQTFHEIHVNWTVSDRSSTVSSILDYDYYSSHRRHRHHRRRHISITLKRDDCTIKSKSDSNEGNMNVSPINLTIAQCTVGHRRPAIRNAFCIEKGKTVWAQQKPVETTTTTHRRPNILLLKMLFRCTCCVRWSDESKRKQKRQKWLTIDENRESFAPLMPCIRRPTYGQNVKIYSIEINKICFADRCKFSPLRIILCRVMGQSEVVWDEPR